MSVIVTDKNIYGNYAAKKRSLWAVVFGSLSGLAAITALVFFLRFESVYRTNANSTEDLLVFLVSVLATFLLASIASLWNNSHGMLRVTPQGIWLQNKRTSKVSQNALWLSWEDIRDVHRGSFGLSAIFMLSNGNKVSTGHFPGKIISQIIKGVKQV